jgi:hypothetical protein
MSETKVNVRPRVAAVQDTGNPVFDATVNLAMGAGICGVNSLKQIHQTMLELYEQEPKPAPKKSRAFQPAVDSVEELGAR